MDEARAGDTATVAALRRGDAAAFAALVGSQQPSFLRIARVWVRDDAAAAEVVQGAGMPAMCQYRLRLPFWRRLLCAVGDLTKT